MVRGSRKVVQQDILTVTANRLGWFMARDIVEAVSLEAGKKYNAIKIGKHLGCLCDAGFMEARRIRTGKNTRIYKYRRTFIGKT